jgi:hypothetical protein
VVVAQVTTVVVAETTKTVVVEVHHSMDILKLLMVQHKQVRQQKLVVHQVVYQTQDQFLKADGQQLLGIQIQAVLV